jgi:MtrB/PioB family decaheme-associated outer membrane protein
MKMRTRTTILIGALLLIFAGVVRAQQEQATPPSQATAAAQASVKTPAIAPTLGSIDFGFRADSVSGNASLYQRFRDLRQGGYVDRFRYGRETERWVFKAAAHNVGYRDQRYTGDFQSIGKVKLAFDWNQVPLWISDTTRSIYKDDGNGVLSIDNSVQQAIQNAAAINPAARDAAITSALTGATGYDLRSRRNTGTLGLVYTVNRDVDLKLDVKTSQRRGYALQTFGFGTSPGLNPAVEINVPMNDRTTDIKGAVEYASQKGLIGVGYKASYFDNARPTVTFDNPLRAVDSATAGPALGRAAMWPNNHSFAFTVNGAYKLPARSRATAYISVGQWDQNADLVSPTTNTALVAPVLERRTAETKADVLSMVYDVSSRPNQFVWLNARYRYYDYANKTVDFATTGLVGDFGITTPIENTPGSIKRGTFDVDASVSAFKYVGLNLGATREDYDRTHRMFEKTTENTYRVSVDSTGNQYVTLRAKYEHSQRDGSHFEEIEGEQPATRHFDVADRTRDRVTGILTVTPVSIFNINASISSGKDKYGETGFGLRNNDNSGWSLGFDILPVPAVNLGVNYGYEKYTALQYSRTANPLTPTDTTFNDPTRDWWDNSADKTKTLSVSADFLKALPKTDIRLGYDLSDGSASYVYGLKPEQKVFTTIPLNQLSPLKNRLSDAKLDVQYFVRPNVALGGGYWYEKYDVADFALGVDTHSVLNPVNGTTGVFASTIYSGYLYRPYKAHTGFLRMTYLW